MWTLKNKLKNNIPIVFSFFSCQLFFRLFEYAHLDLPQKTNYSFWELYLNGIHQDLIISIYYFVICLLIAYIPLKRLSLFINYFLGILILILQFIISEYFKITQIPLDETIFQFSSSELEMITNAPSRFNLNIFMHLFTVSACFVLLTYLFKLLSKKIIYLSVFLLFLIGFVGPLFFFKDDINEERDLISSNKLYYFSRASCYYFWKDSNADKRYHSASFSNLNPDFIASKIINSDYPLLHHSESESSLSPFLNKSNKKPNIVFLIIESLSTDFVGEYAHKTGKLMPFLDSLATESLYFPNFLSTCERTHNVLPAILSSVPNAPNDLMMLKMNPYVDHLSLMSILKEEYYSRFYCGVDLSYHNMNSYMNYHQTDYLVRNWEKKFLFNPFFINNSWGHPDNTLFEKSFLDLHKYKEDKPRLDVFLSISTHDPFDFPNKKNYTDIVKQKIKHQKLTPFYQNKINANPEKYASFVYLDDALKDYFKEAAKNKKEFNNTIFLICGDHGSELCYENPFSKFRIPLLIYSPLIKKPQQFNALNSHLNLAPTILSYLRNEHHLTSPSESSFIGEQIDFSKELNLTKYLCFNSHRLKNEYLLYKNYFLDRNTLYRLNHQLKPLRINAPKIKKQLSYQLSQYNNLASYTYYENKIISQKLCKQIVNRKPFYQIFSYLQRDLNETESQKEFIPIGKDNIHIPNNIQQVKLHFSYRVFLTKTSLITKLPSLVVAINQDKKNVFWKNTKSFFSKKINYNHWNVATLELLVNLKDLPKFESKEIQFYLYNSSKYKFKAKDLSTKLYFQKK